MTRLARAFLSPVSVILRPRQRFRSGVMFIFRTSFSLVSSFRIFDANSWCCCCCCCCCGSSMSSFSFSSSSWPSPSSSSSSLSSAATKRSGARLLRKGRSVNSSRCACSARCASAAKPFAASSPSCAAAAAAASGSTPPGAAASSSACLPTSFHFFVEVTKTLRRSGTMMNRSTFLRARSDSDKCFRMWNLHGNTAVFFIVSFTSPPRMSHDM
mmetsp:Transcript_30358/g.41139  ORF Transcript_30358/g.41139 Transcript_30358/m.41139 type:complete len:213 (-) Transcript_30358:196-834(-)